jgi:hypothetical protein
MKTLIAALALATLIAVPAFTQSAAAAPKARRDAGQSGQDYDGKSGCVVEPAWRLIKCAESPGEGF